MNLIKKRRIGADLQTHEKQLFFVGIVQTGQLERGFKTQQNSLACDMIRILCQPLISSPNCEKWIVSWCRLKKV